MIERAKRAISTLRLVIRVRILINVGYLPVQMEMSFGRTISGLSAPSYLLIPRSICFNAKPLAGKGPRSASLELINACCCNGE